MVTYVCVCVYAISFSGFVLNLFGISVIVFVLVCAKLDTFLVACCTVAIKYKRMPTETCKHIQLNKKAADFKHYFVFIYFFLPI